MLDTLQLSLPSKVIIDIAPALNALNSFTTVAEAEESPGISTWSTQIRKKLSATELDTHYLLAHWIGIDALSNVIDHTAALSSFAAYLELLNELDPLRFRDDILYWLVACPSCRLNYKQMRTVDNPKMLLISWESFWGFFGHEQADEAKIEMGRRVFELLHAPEKLHDLIKDYLFFFWDTYLEEEWDRNLSRLKKAEDHYRHINISGMSHFEIIEQITQRNLRGAFRPEILQQYSILRFIPSPHTGPYILKSGNQDELQIAFGAYRYSDMGQRPTSLDNKLVVEQMKALADGTRLEIINMLRSEKELGTPEIIDRLKLSKSTASRHLRQLYATGIIEARVDEDGLSKYYRVNPDAVILLQSALGNLLG